MIKNMTYGFSIIENHRLDQEIQYLAAARNHISRRRNVNKRIMYLLDKHAALPKYKKQLNNTINRDEKRRRAITYQWTALWTERYLNPFSPRHPDARTIDAAEDMAYNQSNMKSGNGLANIWKNILARTRFSHTK